MRYLIILLIILLTSCSNKVTITVNFNEAVLLKDTETKKIDRVLTEPAKYFIDSKYEIIRYDLKQTQKHIDFQIQLSDDKTYKVYSTYRFKVIPDFVDKLEIDYGKSFDEHVIQPELISDIRTKFKSSNEIESNTIKEIEKAGFSSLDSTLRAKYIALTYFSIDSLRK